MQYLSCVGCRLRVYRGGSSATRPCPRCGGELSPRDGEAAEPPPSTVAKVVGLQKRIAARIGREGTLEDVEREIIARSPSHRPALRRYARALLRARGMLPLENAKPRLFDGRTG
jgi:hypothetical protein